MKHIKWIGLLTVILTTHLYATPAPKYLSVPQWQSCVDTETVDGSYSYYCMPSARPRDCPQTSWDQFVSQNLLDRCKINF